MRSGAKMASDGETQPERVRRREIETGSERRETEGGRPIESGCTQVTTSKPERQGADELALLGYR